MKIVFICFMISTRRWLLFQFQLVVAIALIMSVEWLAVGLQFRVQAADRTLDFAPELTEKTKNIYHVFFDLDWTLFYNIDDPGRASGESLLSWSGERGMMHYRLSDHAVEVIETLLRHPDVRISFFSGGERARNEFLLSRVRLSDGRTLLDIAEHVFSFENLTVVSEDSSLRFSQKYKKSIGNLVPEIDLHRTILVDDQPDFAWRGVRALHAWGQYNFNQRFEVSRVGQAFEPPNIELWALERSKLLLSLGVIESALQADRAGQGSFADIAEQLMRDPRTGEWLPLESVRLRPLFSKGRHSLGSAIGRGRSCPALFLSRVSM